MISENEGIEKTLEQAGFKSLGFSHKNENGPDLTVTKKRKAFTVEVKTCRITKRGSVQVRPVEPARRKDDFIAIKTPCGIVLFEPMKDHLSLCTPKGYRTLPSCFA